MYASLLAALRLNVAFNGCGIGVVNFVRLYKSTARL